MNQEVENLEIVEQVEILNTPDHPKKKAVEQWLNELSYEDIDDYVPSEFAVEFITFIKLVNGVAGEENKSPVIHYKMLDQVAGKRQNIINMCARGMAKTTVMGEYLFLYLAIYGSIPGFGKIDLALYVSDSIENGVKNMRKNVEYRWYNSEFLQKYIPNTRFTDVRMEFTNLSGDTFIVKMYGAKALSLDSKLYTSNGYTTIGECKIGQEIYGPDGKLAKITAKSEVFNKPMYKLELEDGRVLKVSEDHINSVMVNIKPNGTTTWKDMNLTTKELLDIGWNHTSKVKHYGGGISNKCIMKVKNTEPLIYPEKEFEIDPYTLGVILGDGSIKKKASGIVVTGEKKDCELYRSVIPYDLGANYLDKRTNSVMTFAIKGINQKIRKLKLDVHGRDKFIPSEYFFGSIEQRLELLRGLMDTDGSIFGNGRITFVSASERLVDDASRLIRSLGGKIKKTQVSDNAYKIEIWIGLNPFKLPRKYDRFVSNRRHWNNCNVVNIERIADEPSQCISIDNKEHQFLAGEYFRTHNTGVRGSKEMGKRPQLAVLDDLVSDEDARSPTVIKSIEDTVYKAIDYALHPNKRKTIWSGTPFNAKDPLYKATESGAWYVNVYPVCEKFPCTREEFRGGWEDRFNYDFVKAQYDKAMLAGKIADFNQELMLRIMSDEDRLIQDDELVWYDRAPVLMNKHRYNFYITTDFATSEKTSADYSVISVWAYNNNGDWLYVDGVCKRQLMDKNVNDLFRLAQMYKPIGVGVEVTGQQGGFIQWIKGQMIERNIFFNLTSDNNSSKEGIRPNTNKMQRFMTVVPWFKSKKVWFPEQMKNSEPLVEAMNELQNASASGFKSKHDDFIDTISMLSSMNAFKPGTETHYEVNQSSGIWEEVDVDDGLDDVSSTVF